MQIRVPAFTALLVALFAAAGCGGDETGTTSTAATTTSSSSGGGDTINGCTAGAAEDDTGKAAFTITFTDFKYTPPCVKVSKGTNVTFSGDFGLHPLAGGEVMGTMGTVDASSPIKETTTGMMASFTLANAGTFPFYCEAHASLKMYGTIYVE